jgi:hypothetical protein
VNHAIFLGTDEDHYAALLTVSVGSGWRSPTRRSVPDLTERVAAAVVALLPDRDAIAGTGGGHGWVVLRNRSHACAGTC